MILLNVSLLLILLGVVIVQSKPAEIKELLTRMNNSSKKRNGNSLQKESRQMSNRHRRSEDRIDGMIFRRGDDDLPNTYSGSADFAFAGDSFRPSKFVDKSDREIQNPPFLNVDKQNNYNNLQNNNNQKKYWQTNDDNSEVVWPEEEIHEVDWSKLFITEALPNDNQNSVLSQIWQNYPNNGITENNLIQKPAYERPGKLNPCQVRCHQAITNEYNPICGSDNITYKNPSTFRCALSCGKQITGKPDRNCGSDRPIV